MSEGSPESRLFVNYSEELMPRLQELAARAESGEFDPALDIFVSAIENGGIIQAFGTGHSEAFAMEIADRAGGLIPTNKIALRDIVLRGNMNVEMLSGNLLERNPNIADDLYALSNASQNDAFVIASNSGVNGSVVGLALVAKQHGHPVIAVTSMAHTMSVETKHPSGKRLSDVADVVLDNRAPYGDATLTLSEGVSVGAVSSITAAYIAQILTIGTAKRIAETGKIPPVYVSANVPGGDDQNRAQELQYEGRLTRTA